MTATVSATPKEPSNSSIVIGAAAVGIGIIVTAALVLCAGVTLNGFVLMNLWHWFVEPLGMPFLGFWQACGLWLTFRTAVQSGSVLTRNKVTSDSDGLVLMFLTPCALLGLGYLVSLMLS